MERKTFPGMKNMTVEEVVVFSKSLKEDEKSNDEILEMISCVDDLLSIQSCSLMINSRCGKKRHTKKMTKEVMEQRILQANF